MAAVQKITTGMTTKVLRKLGTRKSKDQYLSFHLADKRVWDMQLDSVYSVRCVCACGARSSSIPFHLCVVCAVGKC